MLSAKPVEVYAIFGGRFGTYAEGQWSEFDQARVTEDVTQSFHEGTGSLHPFDGETNYTKPVEHAEGKGSVPPRPPAGPLSDRIVIEDNKIKNYPDRVEHRPP